MLTCNPQEKYLFVFPPNNYFFVSIFLISLIGDSFVVNLYIIIILNVKAV